MIGIDEGQFFIDIVEVAEYLSEHGKIVVIAGLDGTYERKPFNNIVDLVPKCESIKKLSAICAICGHKAFFTERINRP